MECLLAPHGPYQRVLRPADGKEPESIAYIQCAGSRDKSLGVSYCSRVCCMYAIKQAMLLSGALPLAEVTIYYMDIRAFGKGYEQFFQNAKAIQAVPAGTRRMGMVSENDKNTERPERVGVYICHCGGNISDHVDVARVAEEVRKIPGVVAARTNMFMCSDPGQLLIQEDIKSGKVDRVVVASCAPSLHELTFRSAIKRGDMNPFLYEHSNIREQVSWVHAGEEATRKAVTLVAAAIAKAKNLEALEPIRRSPRVDPGNGGHSFCHRVSTLYPAGRGIRLSQAARSGHAPRTDPPHGRRPPSRSPPHHRGARDPPGGVRPLCRQPPDPGHS